MQMVSPFVRYIPDFLLEYILKNKKPFTVSHITGVKSPYAEAEGWFVGCPLTAKQMVELPEEFVIDRIVELYSNAGETVLTPFMGVGSEVYSPVSLGRKAIGIELKDSYFKQASINLKHAADRFADESQMKQDSLI